MSWLFRTIALRETIVGFSASTWRSCKRAAKLSPELQAPLIVTHSPQDAVFFASDESMHADRFISYVRSAPPRSRAFGLLYHLNLELATVAAIMTFVSGLAALIVWRGGVTSVTGVPLILHVVALLVPIAVFTVCLLFGHHVFCWGDERAWLDVRAHSTRQILARVKSSLHESLFGTVD